MLKKTILGLAAVVLMSIVALGIVSASPSGQSGTGSGSFTFLVFALSDADSKGLISEEVNVILTDYVIEELIVPYTFETPEDVKGRLSVQGQTSFELLISGSDGRG